MSAQIQIVLNDNRGWIIEAIARQWERLIAQALPQAQVTVVNGPPLPGAATYLHMTYRRARPVPGARNIIYVPHVDEWYKASKLITCARQGTEFVTMSRQTQALLDAYFGRPLATCITPRSIHFPSRPSPAAPLRFGLFFKLYPDDRKSEGSIRHLMALANAEPDLCQLVLYGQGLPALLAEYPLAKARALASDAAFSPDEYEHKLRQCDYLLYFGKDEGAISVVDAAALGIPVLAIRQGFHIDLALAPGSELFETVGDILAAVDRLCRARRNNASTTDPATLFLGSVAPTPQVRPVSAWRHLGIPLVRNPFLKRKGNLRASSLYLYQVLASQVRRLGRAALRQLHRILTTHAGARLADRYLALVRKLSARTHAEIQLQRTAPRSGQPVDAPDTPEQLNQTGLALAQLQLHKFAVLHFERAIAARPGYAQAHLNLGRSLNALGQHAAAEQCHARAIALDPGLAHTLPTPARVD